MITVLLGYESEIEDLSSLLPPAPLTRSFRAVDLLRVPVRRASVMDCRISAERLSKPLTIPDPLNRMVLSPSFREEIASSPESVGLGVTETGVGEGRIGEIEGVALAWNSPATWSRITFKSFSEIRVAPKTPRLMRSSVVPV